MLNDDVSLATVRAEDGQPTSPDLGSQCQRCSGELCPPLKGHSLQNQSTCARSADGLARLCDGATSRKDERFFAPLLRETVRRNETCEGFGMWTTHVDVDLVALSRDHFDYY